MGRAGVGYGWAPAGRIVSQRANDGPAREATAMAKNLPEAQTILDRSFGAVQPIGDGQLAERHVTDPFNGIPWSSGLGARVQQAADVATVLGDVPDAVGIDEYIGRVITVHGAVRNKGEIDGEESVYVAIDATDEETGVTVVITTGANYVMHQLSRFGELDAYPVTVKPYRQQLGRKGMDDPIHLGPPDRPNAAKAVPVHKGRTVVDPDTGEVF